MQKKKSNNQQIFPITQLIPDPIVQDSCYAKGQPLCMMRLASVLGEGGPLKRFFIKFRNFLVNFSHFFIRYFILFYYLCPQNYKAYEFNSTNRDQSSHWFVKIHPPHLNEARDNQ